MSISVGYSAVEIREFVHEYQRQPHGQKGVWLAERAFSYDTLRRWQSAVFACDLDHGLVPREGSHMSVPPGKRTALGKAIGLLHAMSEEEPAPTPQAPDRSDS